MIDIKIKVKIPRELILTIISIVIIAGLIYFLAMPLMTGLVLKEKIETTKGEITIPEEIPESITEKKEIPEEILPPENATVPPIVPPVEEEDEYVIPGDDIVFPITQQSFDFSVMATGDLYTYPAGTLVIPMDIPKQGTNPDDIDFLRAYGMIYRILDNNMSIDYIVSPDCAFFNATDMDNQSKKYNESYCHGAFVIYDPNTTTPQNEAWTYINDTLRKYYDSTRGIYPFAGVVVHNITSGYVNKSDRMYLRTHLKYAVLDPGNKGNIAGTLDESYMPYTQLTEAQIIAGALSNYSILMVDHFDFTNADNPVALTGAIKNFTDKGGHLSVECIATMSLEQYVQYFPGLKKGPGASGTIRVITEDHPITQTHNLTGLDNEGGNVPTLDMSNVSVNYTILLVDNNYVSKPYVVKMVGRFVNENNSYVLYAGGHIGTRKGDALETPRNRVAVNNFILYTTEVDLPPWTVTNLNETSVGYYWIEWNWTNPDDTDLNHTEIWINGTFYANVSAPLHSINVTGLAYGTTYMISTRTVDKYENLNTTWVNDTAKTLGDAVFPNISFAPPTFATGTYSKNYISVNVTASDTISGLKNITIYLYNSTGLVNYTNSTTSPLFINFTNLPDETYYLNATTYDLAGNQNSTETRIIVLDTTPPMITIINPKNETYLQYNTLLNVTFGPGVQTCWYSFNGGPNTTFTCGTTVNLTAINGLNNITVYANDSLNNLDKRTTWFTVDTTKIIDITIISPANNTFTNDDTPELRLLAIDKLYSTVNYTLYVYHANGSLYSIANTGTLTNNTETTISLSPALALIGNKTTYKIIVAANDSTPNYDNTSELFITLQTPVLHLIAPANGYIDNDGQISFVFRYFDVTYNTANCSLYINGVYNRSNSTTKNNTATTFTVSGLAEGSNQNWTIYCNMSSTVSVNDTMFFSVDKTKPVITVLSPDNTTYNTTVLWFNITANENLSWCGYSLDGTANISMTNSSGNWNALNSSMLQGAHSVIIYCNDTANNTNSSPMIYFVIDSIAPQWSNNITSPDSPTTYAPGASYQFNITWTDDVAISKVIFEFNGANYTPSNNGDVYYITLTGLSANVTGYTYRWYANDSANSWNSTSQLNYIITKAPNLVNLYLNGTQDDVSYVYPTTVNATGTSTAGIVYLFRDNVSITNGSSPQTSISAPAKGMYIYKVNATGNANYTDNSTGVTYDVFITNASGSCSLTFDKLNPQIYGTPIKPSCICTNPETTAMLYRNGTDVTTTENGTATTLPAGTWGYECSSNATQNYTEASNSSTFVINKASTSIALYLNGTHGNRTYNIDDYANFTAVLNISGKPVYIYTDLPGGFTTNGTTPLTRTILLDTGGLFYVTGYFLEDQNHTASNETWFVNVTDTTAPKILSANATPNPISQTNETLITADITDNGVVARSIVQITYPNGTRINYTMESFEFNEWEFNFNDTLQPGQYNYAIFTNDTVGNMNSSSGYSFTVNDIIAPFVSVTQPINGTAFNQSAVVAIKINATDYYNDSVSKVYLNISWDSTYKLVYLNETGNTQIFEYNFTNTTLTGRYNITAFANDSAGNLNRATAYFLVADSVLPNIANVTTMPNPLNQTQTTNITAELTDLSGITTGLVQIIYPNGTAINYTMTQDGGDKWYLGFNDTLQPGVYNYTVFTQDNTGNWNKSARYNLTVNDINAPSVEIISPVAGTNYNQTKTVVISANVTDLYWDSIDFVLANVTYDSAYKIIVLVSNGTHYIGNFTNTSWVGQYNITIIANDTSGNVNNTETTYFTVIDSMPPIIIVTNPTNRTTLPTSTTTVTIQLTTNEQAVCRYNTTNTGWDNMTQMPVTNSTNHNLTINTSDGQTYNYYFICEDIKGNRMNLSYYFTFDVATVTKPPGPGPGGPMVIPEREMCGDGSCSSTEGCVSCPADCGQCSTPPETFEEGIDITALTPAGETAIELTVESFVPQESQKLTYIITNNGDTTFTNLTVNITPPKEDIPEEIHIYPTFGWDLPGITGLSIQSTVIDPELMSWYIGNSSTIDKLGPGESIQVDLDVTAPFTYDENKIFVLELLSNGKILAEKNVTALILNPKFGIYTDYHNDSDMVDVYLVIDNKEGQRLDGASIEFSLNKQQETYFFDIFGPYTIEAGETKIIAQRYDISNNFENTKYDINAKLYSGFSRIGDAHATLDLSDRVPKGPPQSFMDILSEWLG